LTVRKNAYVDLTKTFKLPNDEIKAKALEIAEALKVPQE
jgi:hypothetical protein